MEKRSQIALVSVALFFCAPGARGQRGTGDLRISVQDASGLGLEAAVELVGQATQIRRRFLTGPDGRHTARTLPFGRYSLRVERAGFAAWTGLVEIRSEVPLDHKVTLGIAPIETTVVVTDSDTLLDPHRTGTVFYLGSETLRERRGMQPGRGVVDLVQTTPGWLLEANGVLHPRGSEYDTQYVIDGIPIADNRSPAFAPALEVEDLQSMNVLTANYPAEYGRKLGGVIEVATARDAQPGSRGKLLLERGSFGTSSGYFSGQHSWGGRPTVAGFSVHGARTRRFLDPPAEENFTNLGYQAGLSARLERDLTDRDRLRLSLHRKRVGFLVPNESEQQAAGQRQDRRSSETIGQLSWQRVFSPRALGSLRGMVRDLSARLWSNPFSTPILADQDRGFREGYASGSISYHRGAQEWKAGVETVFSAVREEFGYQITDRRAFDPEVPLRFRFADRRQAREQSLFVQDLVRAGRWTVSAGLRWDRYQLLVSESAVSPRLGVAYALPAAGVVFRASYDRAFQTPAIENLLLASSLAAQRLTDETTGLAVPPSRGDFYQAGLAKSLFGKLRLDANYFRRNIRNFADDDVLLNTGVSFPIAFSSAAIHGFEARLEVPRWGPLSGYASYANLAGTGRLPITGGLFLEEASELLGSTERFAITQDQRNTASARVRYQIGGRAWASFGAWYGSGLPIEREARSGGSADLDGRFGPRVLERVNLARGRVRPSHSFDLAGGIELWRRERRSWRLQAEALNLTDRLNVINFSGLFSGTALAAPRAVTLRLQTEF